ncbi:MAG TPA: four helix bundle protein [Tepidisphaeraceae bacterium]|jgi:four helix bundle protein|nr:four helix bundle protein [Tepidisphaeraceae bacterium]
MNDQATISKEPLEREYDLEQRTAAFGEAVIAFARTIPLTEITRPPISQLVRAGTSIGANYVEADDADSKKDFKFKIGLCRREAKETKHWLRMIVAAEPKLRETARPLWQEAQELNLIFSAIKRKC